MTRYFRPTECRPPHVCSILFQHPHLRETIFLSLGIVKINNLIRLSSTIFIFFSSTNFISWPKFRESDLGSPFQIPLITSSLAKLNCPHQQNSLTLPLYGHVAFFLHKLNHFRFRSDPLSIKIQLRQNFQYLSVYVS